MKQRILFEAIIAVVVLLLVFSLYVAYSTSTPAVTLQWQKPANDTALYLNAAEDGTLYTFTEYQVSAIDRYGTQLWNTTIPAGLCICDESVQPVVASDENGVYVYAKPKDGFEKGAILAFTSHGKLSLELPALSGATIIARDGRVYLYHDYTETVLGPDHNVLFSVKNVSAPATVDEEGRIYLIKTLGKAAGVDYLTPSGIVEAYHANGTLWWTQDIGEHACIQNMEGEYGSLPLYHEGMLLVPVQDGMLSLNTDGTVKWVKRLPGKHPGLFSLAPFDAKGNIYLQSTDPYNDTRGWYLDVLDVNGKPLVQGRLVDVESYALDTNTGIAHTIDTFLAAKDGVGYYAKKSTPVDPTSLDRDDTIIITAYDLLEGKDLWSYRLPSGNKGVFTLTANNMNSLLFPSDSRLSGDLPPAVINACSAEVLPADGIVYVSFWTYNFDYPVKPDESKIAYTGGVFAIGKGGKLEWRRPAGSFATSMVEKDGVLYYVMADGKMSAIKTDLPAGIAVAAVTYLLLRFVVIGAIARARDRLNKNENRNDVLKFIAEHPGSTQYDVARALDMNLGTVRYHMMILTMNHRVAVQRVDNKYVRYFPNSNTFSRDEQVIMSLLRRDPIRRSLELLLERPGLTNIELSRALSMPESATYKYMKELMDKGVISKAAINGKQVYSIRDEYRSRVVQGIKALGGLL